MSGLFITDPFTQVYDSIWDTLEKFGDFAALVKLANEVKYNTEIQPKDKESLQEGDISQATLIPSGSTTATVISSATGEIVQGFTLLIISGDERLQKKYFPLKWATVRALAAAGQNLNGLEFVRRVDVTDQIEDINEFDESMGIQGWNSSLTIVVTMLFNRDELTK